MWWAEGATSPGGAAQEIMARIQSGMGADPTSPPTAGTSFGRHVITVSIYFAEFLPS